MNKCLIYADREDHYLLLFVTEIDGNWTILNATRVGRDVEVNRDVGYKCPNWSHASWSTPVDCDVRVNWDVGC